MAVLRELSPGPEYVVRRIDLHRGLNVLWARPVRREAPSGLFESGVSGHDAGKTTFCRFVRHLLGEPTFGTRALRERVRLHLPRGWIVGEVIVDGAQWVVGRPIEVGPRPFAVPGAKLEAVLRDELRGSFADYETALWAAVRRDLPIDKLPQSDTELGWLHVLPWLARDQEARFTTFSTWRETASEADVPETTIDDRNAIMRAVLGLLSTKEAEAQSHATTLAAHVAALRAKQPRLEYAVEAEAQRLADRLGPEGAGFDGPLIEGVAVARIEKLRAAAGVANDTEPTFADALAEASAEAARLLQARDVAETLADSQREFVKQLEGGNVNAFFAKNASAGDRCNVPMSVAVAHDCPLAKDRPARLDDRRVARTTAADLAVLKRELQELVETARVAREAHAQAERRQRQALAELAAATKAGKDAAAERARASDRADQLEGQLLALRQAGQRVADTSREISDGENELSASRDRQRTLREKNARARGIVSELYEFTIHALLGERASAQVQEHGRELRLGVQQRGEVAGAALSTIKLLAFDLAALTASIEGHGHFPGFLIHDGPREADMDEALYQRLFLFGRLLEAPFEGGEPNFQYIITTTAAPPDEVRTGRWTLQPVLDASTPEGRLLGLDL